MILMIIVMNTMMMTKVFDNNEVDANDNDSNRLFTTSRNRRQKFGRNLMARLVAS